MGKVTGGRLAVKALKQEGVECIFALSGGHVDPLFQACLDENIRLIDVRHEQAAAFMADAWSRDHPCCFGPTRVGTKQADVVLLIGARLNYGLNFGRPGLFGADQKWIQIYIEPTEIGRNRSIEVGIVGDAKAVLGQKIEKARSRCGSAKESDWRKVCRSYLKDGG
jgi:thiamine pyrophosphate-dependent acetolactate synthase large subunit-like protein